MKIFKIFNFKFKKHPTNFIPITVKIQEEEFECIKNFLQKNKHLYYRKFHNFHVLI